jgi:murein DD-endopeptidase MepM/ murein hydrolase activator NlpD
MKTPDFKKLRNIFGGAGTYIVLLLCVAAVGLAGWFFLSRPDSTDGSGGGYAAASGNAEITEPYIEETPEMPEESVADDEPYADVVEITSDDGDKFSSLIVAPVTGKIITSFSIEDLLYSPTMNDWRTHNGVDISADAGTKVRACHGGTIAAVVDDYWMGTSVTIDHGDGTQSVYANLAASPPVKVGSSVAAGDVIGSVGATARSESAIAPHLHFSVMDGGAYVNPETYLAG